MTTTFHCAPGLSLPPFRDGVESYLRGLDPEALLQLFSPLWEDCAGYVRAEHRDRRYLLNMGELQVGLLGPSSEKVLYPDPDAPEFVWKKFRLIRPDYTERQDMVTSLMCAGYLGDLDAMKTLIHAGAYLDKQVKNGNSVLMETVLGCDVTRRADCVKLLLKSGARANIQNQAGHTALTAAAYVGDVDVVRSIIQLKQPDVNHATKRGSTALTMAVAGNHLDIVHYLVTQCNANILVEDETWLTALGWGHMTSLRSAGYLVVQMGLQKHLEDYIKRRVELLDLHPDDPGVFTELYMTAMLLLSLRPARFYLLEHHVLDRLTTGATWREESSLRVEQHFMRALPWIIAVGCSMLYDEELALIRFLNCGAADHLLETVDDLLPADSAEDHYAVLALFLPIISFREGRFWITKHAFKYRKILAHFADEQGVLDNKQDVCHAYKEMMDSYFNEYELRTITELLGVSRMRKVVPERSRSLRETLHLALSHFPDLRQRAAQKLADKNMQELIQQEECEKERRERRRESRRNRRRRNEEKRTVAEPMAIYAAVVAGTPVQERPLPDRAALLAQNKFLPLKPAKKITSFLRTETGVKPLVSVLEAGLVEGGATAGHRVLEATRNVVVVEGETEDRDEEVARRLQLGLQPAPEEFTVNVNRKKKRQAQQGKVQADYAQPQGHEAKKEDAPTVIEKTKKNIRPKLKGSNTAEPTKKQPKMKCKQEATKHKCNQPKAKNGKNNKPTARRNDIFVNLTELQMGNYKPPALENAPKPPKVNPWKVDMIKPIEEKLSPEWIPDAKMVLDGTPERMSPECSPQKLSPECSPQTVTPERNISPEYPPQTVTPERKMSPECSPQIVTPERNMSPECYPQTVTPERKMSPECSPQIATPERKVSPECYPQTSSLECFGKTKLSIENISSPERETSPECPTLRKSSPYNSGRSNTEAIITQAMQEAVQQKVSDDMERLKMRPGVILVHQLEQEVACPTNAPTNHVSPQPARAHAPKGKVTQRKESDHPGFTSIWDLPPDATVPTDATIDCAASGDAAPNLLQLRSQYTRSIRWRPLLDRLVAMPQMQRRKVGCLNFSMADPSLLLAKGNQGTVVTVGLLDTGAEVAVKRVLRTAHTNIHNELHQLRMPELQHACIIKCKDFVEDEDFSYLTFELCEATLEEQVTLSRRPLSVPQQRRLVAQLLRGLHTLHSARVLHGNLTPSNILIDNEGNLRIASFGWSCQLAEGQEIAHLAAADTGARWWQPREVLLSSTSGIENPYSAASDMQVAGMLVHYILTGGVHPFGDNPMACEINIRCGTPYRLASLDDVTMHLLCWMLHSDAHRRKPASQCLRHPYFWPEEERSEFLRAVGLQPEICSNSYAEVCQTLNNAKHWLEVHDWHTKVPRELLEYELSRQPLGSEVIDLVRFVSHLQDNQQHMPEHVKVLVEAPYTFLQTRWPHVMVAVYDVVFNSEWRKRPNLARFFQT